jgi:hypothetical protein
LLLPALAAGSGGSDWQRRRGDGLRRWPLGRERDRRHTDAGGEETGCCVGGWVGSATGSSGFIVPAWAAGAAPTAGSGSRDGSVAQARGRRWGTRPLQLPLVIYARPVAGKAPLPLLLLICLKTRTPTLGTSLKRSSRAWTASSTSTCPSDPSR